MWCSQCWYTLSKALQRKHTLQRRSCKTHTSISAAPWLGYTLPCTPSPPVSSSVFRQYPNTRSTASWSVITSHTPAHRKQHHPTSNRFPDHIVHMTAWFRAHHHKQEWRKDFSPSLPMLSDPRDTNVAARSQNLSCHGRQNSLWRPRSPTHDLVVMEDTSRKTRGLVLKLNRVRVWGVGSEWGY